nr:unnamed protein product [Spirometra erinaceieuropaei]
MITPTSRGADETPDNLDSKRDEFRTYLEKSGLIDNLTKVLVSLYEEPEKPSNPTGFVKEHLGSNAPASLDVESMRVELEDLRQRVEALEVENTMLKEKLSQRQIIDPNTQSET